MAPPIDLATAPCVFKKLFALVLGLLSVQGVSILGHLDDLLLREKLVLRLRQNMSLTVSTPKSLGLFPQCAEIRIGTGTEIAVSGPDFDTMQAKGFCFQASAFL